VPEPRWKRHERLVARALGGQRQSNTGLRGPDVVAGSWVCEVKLRSRLPLWLERGLSQAEAAARERGSAPLLVIVWPQGRGRRAKRLAILPLEVLSNLAGSEVIRDEGDAANR
jgi:hypothetical protein